ncbi:MAG TPA: ABC transporter ATP-binding protein [Patescibacteria group bacterium]|nr:ABC transporter ATP-binding protein [Patescibacteria group bacterium]
MPSLIKLSNVNKIFQLDEELTFQALKNINLEIKKGEFVAIIGPSGSGKSTLMNILGLLDHPTSGSYHLEGSDVAHLKDDHRAQLRNQKIGFVFQSFNLLARTKACENVALPLIYSGVAKEVREKQAKKSLDSVGLSDKYDSKPSQLSGGQQQRVAIARALVTNPEIIFADEPTGNLDSKSGVEILSILKRLNSEGKTIILITHDKNIAGNAQRIIRIKDGEIEK